MVYWSFFHFFFTYIDCRCTRCIIWARLIFRDPGGTGGCAGGDGGAGSTSFWTSRILLLNYAYDMPPNS